MDFEKLKETLIPKLVFGIIVFLVAVGVEFYELKNNVANTNNLDKQQSKEIHEVITELSTNQKDTNNSFDKDIFELKLKVKYLEAETSLLMNDFYFKKY